MTERNLPAAEAGPFVQPLLSLAQLADHDIKFLIGTGALASYVYSALPPEVRARIVCIGRSSPAAFEDRPVRSLREFFSLSQPHDAVIFADENRDFLQALVVANQRCIIDATEFARSYFASLRQRLPASRRCGVLSTVPRSGTHRILYFLYALNELLHHPRKIPSPHKLYLYYRVATASPFGTPPGSKYSLDAATEFLRLNEFQWGHFLPPGSLHTFGSDGPFAAEYAARWRRTNEHYEKEPDLARATLGAKHDIEPQLPIGNPTHVRFAFVTRDVFGHLSSVLSTFEMMRSQSHSAGSQAWDLGRYAQETDAMPFGFFSNPELLLPRLLKEAIDTAQPVTKIIIEQGYLRSLILDYVFLNTAARRATAEQPGGLTVKVFPYDAMIRDESRFLLDFTSFMRGAALSPVEQGMIEQARIVTSGNRRVEEALGHSLSYSELSRNPMRLDSHMTAIDQDSGGRGSIRQTVSMLLEDNREQIECILRELTADAPGQMGQSDRLA